MTTCPHCGRYHRLIVGSGAQCYCPDCWRPFTQRELPLPANGPPATGGRGHGWRWAVIGILATVGLVSVECLVLAGALAAAEIISWVTRDKGGEK